MATTRRTTTPIPAIRRSDVTLGRAPGRAPGDDRPARSRITRTALALALAVFLALCLVEAAQRALAGLHARAAVRALDGTARERPSLQDARVLAFAEARLRDALDLDPSDPRLMSALAETLVMRDKRLRVDADRVDVLALREALALLRAETRSRPTWPYAWVNLATTKRALSELDSEFAYALDRAAALGPWELPVQRGIIETGVPAWRHLAPGTRETIRRTVGRALRIQPSETMRILGRYGREDLAEGSRKPKGDS